MARSTRLEPARTLFLVASKSGGTVEPASMEKLFWQHVSAALGSAAGRQFVAVTDPGTELAHLAASRGYRKIFLNPPDIGGRFSALSLFGLVPAALIGAPVRDMLSGAADMAEGCRQENYTNPGLDLGVFIGFNAAEGRDKLTVVLPPSLRGARSVDRAARRREHRQARQRRAAGRRRAAGPARTTTAPTARSSRSRPIATRPTRRGLQALEAAGHPVLRLSTRIGGLGAEFFRWEFATAVAGAVLGINPFDEPNVSEAKEKTKAILAKRDFTGGTPGASDGIRVFVHVRRTDRRRSRRARRSHRSARVTTWPSCRTCRPTRPSRRPSPASASGIRAAKRTASTFGVGPALSPLDRAVSQGRAEHVRRVRASPARTRPSTPIPGAPFTFAQSETRAGGRRLPDARGARSADGAHPPRSRRRSGRGAATKLFAETRSDRSRGRVLLTTPGAVFERARRTPARSPCAGCCRGRPSSRSPGSRVTSRCHIASGVPNSISDTPATRSMQRA